MFVSVALERALNKNNAFLSLKGLRWERLDLF